MRETLLSLAHGLHWSSVAHKNIVTFTRDHLVLEVTFNTRGDILSARVSKFDQPWETLPKNGLKNRIFLILD